MPAAQTCTCGGDHCPCPNCEDRLEQLFEAAISQGFGGAQTPLPDWPEHNGPEHDWPDHLAPHEETVN